MGIYDRDYERSYDTGSGWRDSYSGGGSWSINAQLLIALVGAYVAQLVFEPWFTGVFALPSDWWREPWRVYGLLTYGFLHDTNNFNHLFFNGLVLFFFGRSIESRFGAREYLLYFLAAVLFAGVAWSVTEAVSEAGGAVLLGASGGITAVLVLFALLYPNSLIYIWGVLPVPAWLMVGLSVMLDVMGFFGAGRGNVAFSAHLGGALFAYLYFRNGWRLSDHVPSPGSLAEGVKLPKLKRGPNLKIHREEDASEAPLDDRVDAILKKIQQSGQESLTAEEQKLLQRASQRYQRRGR